MKRKILIPFLLVIAMIATVFGVTACGGSSDGITLNPTEITIEEGNSATVTATYSGNDTITWTSSDTSVATVAGVSKAGLIKGVSEGTATVTATAGEYSASCTVNVTAAVTYTISLDGSAVTTKDVVRGESLTFTATASDGSDISYWAVGDTSIATVSNGVVTGVSYGTTTLSAGKDSSHCGKITLNVVAKEGTVGYTLEFKTEAEALDSNTDTWYYWNEYAELTANYYDDGEITITFTNNAGNWYNYQLFYKNSTLTVGNSYKLSLTINTTAAGSITINGTVVNLTTGDNNVYVYYTESASPSASIQLGVEGEGTSITAGTVKISNATWTELQAETLKAPTLTVTDGVISIADTNDAEKVSGYKLYLYDSDGNLSGAVTVTNGMKVSDIPTNTVNKGTYKGYLRAIGASDVYYNSENSTSYIEIEVTEDPVYDLTYAGETAAVADAGAWYYWQESGNFSGNYNAGTLTVEFSSNAGNWYDTQLFYKNCILTAGTTYKLSFTLNSTATGTIYVNGTVCTINEGNNTIEVTYIESYSGASVSIQFGVPESIDIASATIVISNIAWEVSTEDAGSGETYDAADFTTLVDELDGESTYDITHGEEKVAVSTTDTVYVWYIGDYEYWNEWAAVTNSDVTASYNNGTITWSTTKNATYGSTYHYANQLFYKNSALTAGTTYMLTLTINSNVATSITVNGTVVKLTVGENTVTVFYTEGSGASISIQLGVNGVGSDTDAISLTLSNIEWYSNPNASTGDSGDEDDDDTQTYDAADFTTLVDELDGESTYDITHDEEKVAVSTTDTVYVWYLGDWQYWGDWAAVTNSDVTANYNNGTITWSTTKNATYGAYYYYANQLFYKNSTLTAGTTYMLKLTINSNVACSITVNGTIVELTIGENTVTVFYTEGATTYVDGDVSSLDIQLGVDGQTPDADEVTLTLSNIKWYAQEATSGGDEEQGETGGDSGDDTDRTNATAVTLTFVNSYNDYYFQFTASSEYDITSASELKVNGSTATWKEYTSTGDNSWTFKVYVSSLTLSEYVFDWYDDTGAVVATATYTPATTDTGDGESGDGGTTSGDETDRTNATAVTLTFVNSYNDYYFEFTASSEYDITLANYVKVNGTQQWKEYTSTGDNSWTFKVYVGDLTLTEYVFDWYDDTGAVVATATYTPETSGSEDGGETGGDSGDDSGDTDPVEAVELTATYINFYGQTWLELEVNTTLDLSTYTLYYNGNIPASSNVFQYGDASLGVMHIQVQISTDLLTEVPATNVITFYDANDNLVATVTYTPD